VPERKLPAAAADFDLVRLDLEESVERRHLELARPDLADLALVVKL
jgi:hypothetical protein